MDAVGQFVFYLFALTAVASALLFVTRRGPVSAALWLVSTMFSIAGIYILLDVRPAVSDVYRAKHASLAGRAMFGWYDDADPDAGSDVEPDVETALITEEGGS